MNKKILFFIIFIFILILIIFALRFLSGDEDTWLCQNCQWVKHGQPSAPKPSQPCCEEKEVIVFSPQPNQVIESPFSIEGKARGFWFFEASFPIRILDDKNNELGTGMAQAQFDWMTSDFVPFTAEIKFNPTSSNQGTLVFEKDNPSGLPENARQIEMPIRFTPVETMKVKVFFNNDKLDQEFSCAKVFPVEREIVRTQAVARAALEELLKGATEAEKAQGFFTSINPNVKIQKLTIDPPTGGGVAKVDFDEQMEWQMGGSCRVSAIRSQITQTLKQFSTVKEVIISVNGRTEDILQP